LQSLLRGEITKSYYVYKEKGWIPLYALQSIEANYKNYEALGENGVIDGLWKEMMALPHTKPEDDKNEESN
jgi:mannitol/fructose-specific phosphotransferase system IIA component (Ntr-type)